MTKVLATGHYEAVTGAINNVTSCQNAAATKHDEFETAVTALQEGMRGVITEHR